MIIFQAIRNVGLLVQSRVDPSSASTMEPRYFSKSTVAV